MRFFELDLHEPVFELSGTINPVLIVCQLFDTQDDIFNLVHLTWQLQAFDL